jgi:hypothetical protein
VYVAGVDGPSARSGSDPGQPESQGRQSRPLRIGRELDELRARAYGPDADIEDDPAALARLIELEAARVAPLVEGHDTVTGAAAPAGTAPSTSFPIAGTAVGESLVTLEPSSATGRRTNEDSSRSLSLSLRANEARSRLPFVAALILVVGTLVYATARLVVPHPDATLQLDQTEPNSLVVGVLDNTGVSVDPDTLRQFQPYRDIGVFSIEHSDRPMTCLVVLDSAGSGRFDFDCAPHGVEVILHQWVGDGFADWLPEGSVVSFHLRDGTVEIFLHAPPAAS